MGAQVLIVCTSVTIYHQVLTHPFSPAVCYSFHPYIFFNSDGASITFVGFTVTEKGDLNDPRAGRVLERQFMSPELHRGLKRQYVDMNDNYLLWPKHTMIIKLATVMGIEFSMDPDESYVLTSDNVMKILAIHMRFR